MYIEEYYSRVKNKEILVGRELMAQLDMLMYEIENAESLGLKIETEESDKRIKFIETKCRHFEAPYAGKPFRLELFQKAFIEAIFAIKIYDDELKKYVRKYQDVLFLVGRKNGKTPLIGAICLAEWFCGEAGKKIMCASNDYDQADLMFQAINAMREESRELASVTRKNQTGMYFGNPKQRSRKGKFSYQNKGSIRKLSARAGAKEGRNLGVGAVDEVFEMEDDGLVMPIRQSLSTQDEPLYFELTTEGFTQNGYLDSRLVDARRVLKGELLRPRWLIWMYTQDSEHEVWQDEASWVKSNPGLGAIKKWSALRNLVEEAKTASSVRAFVLAKEFNIKQNNASAWLQEGDIANTAVFDLEMFRGCAYVGGTDISETTDLTNARAMFMRYEGEGKLKKYMKTMYFVPESKADAVLDDNRLNPEKLDYWGLAKQGLVTVIPGSEVDVSYIVKWYYALYTEYRMVPFKIGYDDWMAKEFKKLVAGTFGQNVPENINMDFKSLSNPMRSLEADLKAKNLIYDNNKMDIYCLKNTAVKLNNIGQVMPVKVQGQSKIRIDGTVGMVICYATFSRYRSEFLRLIK